jgi:hypothetical protein
VKHKEGDRIMWEFVVYACLVISVVLFIGAAILAALGLCAFIGAVAAGRDDMPAYETKPNS